MLCVVGNPGLIDVLPPLLQYIAGFEAYAEYGSHHDDEDELAGEGGLLGAFCLPEYHRTFMELFVDKPGGSYLEFRRYIELLVKFASHRHIAATLAMLVSNFDSMAYVAYEVARAVRMLQIIKAEPAGLVQSAHVDRGLVPGTRLVSREPDILAVEEVIAIQLHYLMRFGTKAGRAGTGDAYGPVELNLVFADILAPYLNYRELMPPENEELRDYNPPQIGLKLDILRIVNYTIDGFNLLHQAVAFRIGQTTSYKCRHAVTCVCGCL